MEEKTVTITQDMAFNLLLCTKSLEHEIYKRVKTGDGREIDVDMIVATAKLSKALESKMDLDNLKPMQHLSFILTVIEETEILEQILEASTQAGE